MGRVRGGASWGGAEGKCIPPLTLRWPSLYPIRSHARGAGGGGAFIAVNTRKPVLLGHDADLRVLEH